MAGWQGAGSSFSPHKVSVCRDQIVLELGAQPLEPQQVEDAQVWEQVFLKDPAAQHGCGDTAISHDMCLRCLRSWPLSTYEFGGSLRASAIVEVSLGADLLGQILWDTPGLQQMQQNAGGAVVEGQQNTCSGRLSMLARSRSCSSIFSLANAEAVACNQHTTSERL